MSSNPFINGCAKLGGGDIFMIGSRPLFEGSSREILPYTLSKSLLLQLTHSLNESSAEDKVFTSLIVPGTIDTPINRQQMPAADFTQWTQPQDIAHEIHQMMEQKEHYPQKGCCEIVLKPQIKGD